MNPLLKKEIRLLLPALGLTLLLVFASAFLFSQRENPGDALENFTPVWLGVMILCASSFGREFSLGTFSTLLVQPFPRRQYWMTKVVVLAAALVSVLLVYSLCSHLAKVSAMGSSELAWLGLLLLTGIASGLWLALLVRQMMAVVWLVGLAPGLLCVPFLLVLAHYEVSDNTISIILYVVLFIYSVVGIGASWFILRRAEDVPWSGGKSINLPEWLAAKMMPRSAASERLQVPWRALIRKELHFNQVLLFGMAGLFLLDLGEVAVRFLRRNSPGDMNTFLQVVGLLPWVLVPLVIGCTSIAEERKLGTMEGQLCQPVPRRRQFLIKFGFVLLFGGLLSTFLPLGAEYLAWTVGATHDLLPDAINLALMTAGMCGLAIICFFASSLTRNVLQALPIAVGMYVGVILLVSCFVHVSGLNSNSPTLLWSPVLPGLLLAVLLPSALVWLAYLNFRCLHEAARIWWRNSLGIAVVLIFTVVASLLIYHRAWEKLTPFEPAHGTARWTMNQPPTALHSDIFNNMLILLPDGRSWFGCLIENPPAQFHSQGRQLLHDLLLDWKAPHLKAGQFIDGSDWSSLSAGHLDMWAETGSENAAAGEPRLKHFVGSRETVGIRSDGTLWLSEKAGGPNWAATPMVQFGTESDWQQVMGERSLTSVLLLKKDGTLWRWGDKTISWARPPFNWTGLRSQPPRQIGTNSDWQELVQMNWTKMGQKADGSVWNLWYNDKTGSDVMVLNTNMARAGFASQHLDGRKLATGSSSVSAGIRPDGTLWIWGDYLYNDVARQNKFALLRSSVETNWLAVALGQNRMTALKSDGTLWRWGGDQCQQAADAFTGDPVRLGIHNDWVALEQTSEGAVSLAADGSLWLWPEWVPQNEAALKLIEPPQKPELLGNILAAN